MYGTVFLSCQPHVGFVKKPFHSLLCQQGKIGFKVYFQFGNCTSIKSCLSRESSGSPFSATDVFTFLALRAQESICKDTAKVDGLGKFYSCGDVKDDSSLTNYDSIHGLSNSEWNTDDIPSLFNWCPPHRKHIWSDRKSSRMLGGRKFSRAFVDVWRASQKERHPLLGRRFYQGRRNAHVVWMKTVNVTSAIPLTENLDIAGVSLVLEPRNVHIPIFRADLRYFELNHGGLWWFVGSVDLIISALSSSSIFAKEAHFVYNHWKQLCEKHRSIIPFVRDPSQESVPFGNLLGDFDTVERGRSRAFAFVNDVMDSLLSVYLPLTRKPSSSSKQLKRNKNRKSHLGFFQLVDPSLEANYASNTYSLSGGTVLESSFSEAAPLVMWRFNLFPPPGTAAAKVIAELRSGRNNSQIDPLGCVGWF
ncbi:hypothetical protein GpartN1_g327.t1 [Galdieria partita]|uniref:Coproporphyrinogen oxidase n=1 Tax=Galdieria partita TaxID=83374 RepID=A0A9C7PRK0_9RHOD|nr:hypothetical protein GpartN1_g327.t1 [Galdieria partita]